MGPLTLLIKPASGSCNMRCKYCFYADEAENREVASYGMMSDATLEAVVRFGLENARGACTFAFQGGEPTLAGLDFYRRLVAMQRAHNTRGLRVYNTIQTNGYLIDREWADFLARERFLTGLSLDGGKDVHDLYRVDARGEGTFARVMRAAQTLAAAGAEFNILTVVTAQTARSIGKIYGFFKRNHFRYQQYIACLDPIGAVRGGMPYSLTPNCTANFCASCSICGTPTSCAANMCPSAGSTTLCTCARAARRKAAACGASAARRSSSRRTAACTRATFMCWMGCASAPLAKTRWRRWSKSARRWRSSSSRAPWRRSAAPAGGTRCAAAAAGATASSQTARSG